MEKAQKVIVKPPYIKLNQLLKFLNIIEKGSDDKNFIASNIIRVNNELEERRGRKLYKGDIVTIKNTSYEVDFDEN